MFDRFMKFLREVKLEATKVTWPSLKELRASTIVVLVACAIIAVFIAIVDRVLSFGVHLLL